MASKPAANSQFPPSPGSDATPPLHTPVPSWTPPVIPYNETFEDEVMEAVLTPVAVDEMEEDGLDINLPVMPDELPLALDDFRRKHPSAVPGIKLPTPTSDLSGAPGPPDMVLHAMAKKLMREHGITGPAEFSAFIDAEIKKHKTDLVRRMQRRREAKAKNEEVDRELAKLEMERDMQRRVAEKWRQGRRGSDD